jgi:hypothetical protein
MDSTSTLPESTGSSDKNTEEKEFYVPLEFSDKDFHSEQTMDRESVYAYENASMNFNIM